jgi:hypothetical protein
MTIFTRKNTMVGIRSLEEDKVTILDNLMTGDGVEVKLEDQIQLTEEDIHSKTIETSLETPRK